MMQMLTLPETPMDEGNDSIIKTEAPEEASQEGSLLSSVDGLQDFELYISDITGGQQMKSELDQYLEEAFTDRVEDFDVLVWWRLNRMKYPTLSRMASDILSISVSTVASDSVFNTEIKRMDSYRTSLGPATLEALICAKDWLKYGSFPQPPAL
ncbi:PREDICTED: zinc finger BED domain-containing protein DAYSLEEPER-like [Prunus mume]|uniref:Zinc finger BED domain-containing protein DAYSLEEPER-like n=1 Tax=Prunus mume TaxID=102107 RepID=A0ABM1LNU7_PRUMU|nr:PREDICTED: zinc finger BED domain-containing protein DAYSLEEPER-like [Prunus mume]